MIEESRLNKLKYFFECYLNVSADYSDLDALVKEFREIENEEYIKELKEEIELLLPINDIEFIRNFIRKYGMRDIENDNKIKWILNYIRENI